MNFRAILVTVAVVGTLAGCTHSRPIYLPDGREGHYVNCSGGYRNWGACYETASKVCGVSGYEIVERLGDNPQVDISQSSGVAVAQSKSRSTGRRSFIIACKQ